VLEIKKAKYSRTQVNKSGKLLYSYFWKQEKSHSEMDIARAFVILNYWRTCHVYPINTFQATLRNKLKGIDEKAIVVQRLKRLPSIVIKLNRFPTMKLTRMQDIGGLRAIVSSMKEVHKLVNNYEQTKFLHELYKKDDYIELPKKSGYRSVHLVYRYNNPLKPEYNGLFVELQIRTRIQHSWATAVETMGTYLDHALKSSEGPEAWLQFFTLASSAFAILESTAKIPEYEQYNNYETYKMLIEKAISLDIKQKLMAFSIATRNIRITESKGIFHLIILDLKGKSVQIQSFSKDRLTEANKYYLNIEKQIAKGKKLQAVLVSAKSIKTLKQAYPNFFLDTREFIKHIDRIERKVKDGRSRFTFDY